MSDASCWCRFSSPSREPSWKENSRLNKSQVESPVDLFLPGAVVAVTCALTWGTLQVAGPAILGDKVQGLEEFVSRILLLAGLVAAVVGFLTWPAVAAVLVATARVLWNRDCEFRPFLAGAGWCHLPLLVSGAVVFVLLLNDPPTRPTDLESFRWLTDAATFCHAVLLAVLVSRRVRLPWWKAFLTVVVPWLVYRLVGLAIGWFATT